MGEAAAATPVATSAPSRLWPVWGIVKQELLFLCLMLMEVTLLTPLALFVMRWTRFWPATLVTLWLLMLMLLPFNIVRFLTSLNVSRKRQWQIVVLALVVTLFISWRVLLFPTTPILDLSWLTELYSNVGESGSTLWTRILILFLLVVFAWWRGLRMVNFRADVQQVGLRLRVGILLFIPLSLLPNLRSDAWSIMPYILLFFLSGLTAISLVRAEQIEQDHSGFSASLNPGWVGTIFLASLAIALIAGLFAAAVSGDLIRVIYTWLTPLRVAALALITVALGTVFYLFTPLFFLLDLFLIFLTRLFSSLFANFGERLGVNNADGIQGLGTLLPDPDEAAELTGPTIPDTVIRIAIILVMLGIILLVSLALTRRFRTAYVATRASEPIRDLGGNKTAAETIGQRVLRRLGILRHWRTAASIRKVYQQMCQAADGLGYPRTAAETPYEYLTTLAEVWPNNHNQCLLITEAFIRIRYGEIPETQDEVEQILEAWRVLEQTKHEN